MNGLSITRTAYRQFYISIQGGDAPLSLLRGRDTEATIRFLYANLSDFNGCGFVFVEAKVKCLKPFFFSRHFTLLDTGA